MVRNRKIIRYRREFCFINGNVPSEKKKREFCKHTSRDTIDFVSRYVRYQGSASAQRVSRCEVSPLARSARPPRCLGARRLFLVLVIYSNLRDHDSYSADGSSGWYIFSFVLSPPIKRIHSVFSSSHFSLFLSPRTTVHQNKFCLKVLHISTRYNLF